MGSETGALPESTLGKRGYFASTVGRDEEVIRNYIRSQEEVDRRMDQLKLFS